MTFLITAVRLSISKVYESKLRNIPAYHFSAARLLWKLMLVSFIFFRLFRQDSLKNLQIYCIQNLKITGVSTICFSESNLFGGQPIFHFPFKDPRGLQNNQNGGYKWKLTLRRNKLTLFLHLYGMFVCVTIVFINYKSYTFEKTLYFYHNELISVWNYGKSRLLGVVYGR